MSRKGKFFLIWVKSQTTNKLSRSVEADRNVAFVSTNSLQSKLNITIKVFLYG